MIIEILTGDEIDMIKESLRYTIKAYREYTEYPSYEFKQEQIARARELIDKLARIKKATP